MLFCRLANHEHTQCLFLTFCSCSTYFSMLNKTAQSSSCLVGLFFVGPGFITQQFRLRVTLLCWSFWPTEIINMLGKMCPMWCQVYIHTLPHGLGLKGPSLHLPLMADAGSNPTSGWSPLVFSAEKRDIYCSPWSREWVYVWVRSQSYP